MISLIIASIAVMPGCYDPGKNATVSINLGNMPVAKYVEKKSFIDKIFSLFEKDAYASFASSDMGISVIHIVALSGDTVIASMSIDATSPEIITPDGTGTDIVEFEVPAGSERNIVVLGEDSSGIITYYGKTARTYNFAAGDNIDVEVIMSDMSILFIGTWNNALNREEWDKILGASYNIYDADGYYIGSTTNTYYPLTIYTSYRWDAEFSFAGAKSAPVNFYTS